MPGGSVEGECRHHRVGIYHPTGELLSHGHGMMPIQECRDWGGGMTQVRIVAWNCAMALHRKWDALLSCDPDIAVVAECAPPEVVAEKLGRPLEATSSAWMGSLAHKGLGIFTFGDWHAAPTDFADDDLQFILPAHITGPASFILLAAWAMNHRAKRTPPGTKPGRQVQLAIERARVEILDVPFVIAGDFNSNVRWDKRPGPRTMGDCIAACESVGLRSAFHAARGVAHGEEAEPTHFWEAKGGAVNEYHIDYVWAPRTWPLRDVTVGNRSDWYDSKLSDHAPLVCTYEVPG